MFTFSEEYNIAGQYRYGIREQVMRVTYSVLLVSVHIKVINVLSFYESIAFMIKIIEKLVGEIASVMIFLISILVVFSLANDSLDIIYYNADMPNETGDYTGFFGIYGASFMSTLRNSLGDFDVGTYKFLPWP